MKKSFDEYFSAGLLVLFSIGLLCLVAYVIPNDILIIGFGLFVALIITTAICYILGRLAYYIMDKLE